MLDFLERHTPLRFQLTTEGDPLDGNAGGKTFGRMVTTAPLRLRRSPLPHVYIYQEVIGDDPYHYPLRVALRLAPRIVWRWLTGARTKGAALITGLLAGCLAHGCRLETAARVERLNHSADGGVIKPGLAGRGV
ncbi:hypothetical protein [Candidatus Sodalis endolongispinus]|uniref:hypothetical protein n=1 Tax=Candidatus Sodalis endolongispinus TaxID=2812662 RepID=UPI001FE2FCCE|nr:hypothetical protein [Candidatus Sodalis endolongispinus]